MANALVSIQVIPTTNHGEDTIPFVDEAIKVIANSRVKYVVNPLETTMEGNLTELLNIIEQINERMIELGCPKVISQVKILYNPKGASMEKLTEKYRNEI